MEAIQAQPPVAAGHHLEEWHTPQGRIIREVVFGANDGLVTLVGFVAGITGTLSSTRPIILASEALIVAGSLSMGIGAYLSSKAQREFFEHEIAQEKWEIATMPEKETEEVREHYTAMGFLPNEVDMIVKRITSDPKLWLRFMMHEELGLSEEHFDNPFVSGLIVAAAFFAAAWIPVIPYFFASQIPRALQAAMTLSIGVLFLMGMAKARVTNTSWAKSAFEMAGLGALAMVVGLAASRFAMSIVPQ